MVFAGFLWGGGGRIHLETLFWSSLVDGLYGVVCGAGRPVAFTAFTRLFVKGAWRRCCKGVRGGEGCPGTDPPDLARHIYREHSYRVLYTFLA